MHCCAGVPSLRTLRSLRLRPPLSASLEDPTSTECCVCRFSASRRCLCCFALLLVPGAFRCILHPLLAHVLIDHGLPDALPASSTMQSHLSAHLRCAAYVSQVSASLAALLSARPARFTKRLWALLVYLLFTTVSCCIFCSPLSLAESYSSVCVLFCSLQHHIVVVCHSVGALPSPWHLQHHYVVLRHCVTVGSRQVLSCSTVGKFTTIDS